MRARYFWNHEWKKTQLLRRLKSFFKEHHSFLIRHKEPNPALLSNSQIVPHWIRGLYHKLEKRQQPIYCQTEWSQHIFFIRYSIARLPCSSGFCAVLHPVIVVPNLLLVDRCPTRVSSIFWRWGSLGGFGCVMRAFYSNYTPRISPTQVDAVGCKVSGPTIA